ncbi:MAG: SPOR domain-containing protein [Polaromonas sp.]
MNRQQGGTLLGLIIGVLIGLGAALVVAVYITKVPVPFMTKSPPRNPESDSAEARKNKDWNPNAALAGKNSTTPPSASGEVGNVTASPVAPAAPATPAAQADPLGDLARAKTQAPSSGSGVDPFSYFIQAGAFRTPEDADQQRAKLLLLGMSAKVSEREQSGRTVYRVRLGPFNNREDADKVKERLDSNSIETALVRVQR